jgi:branched-chain amino acid aminotransferase
MTSHPQRPAFGTVLTSHMAVATFQNGQWSKSELKPVVPLEISPAAHVLHYASTCF